MLREALIYPARADEETLLVGASLAIAVGLLVRLGVFTLLAVAPVVLLAGYVLAVLRESAASADGESANTTSADGESANTTSAGGASASADAPPAFADARALAVDGARALAVAVGYLAIPVAALAVTVGGANAGGRAASLETTAVVLGAGTVVLVACAGFAYLLPAALAGVARTRRLRSAVEPGRLRRTVTDARYFVAWVAALTVVSVAALLISVLASFGRPGEAVALAVGFYAVVVVARLFGRRIGR